MNNDSWVLDCLTETDIDRLSIPNISLDEVLKIKEQVLSIEDKEERRKIAFKYLNDNLDDLKTLKHWLNALHLKMFWEYFKNELEKKWLDWLCKVEWWDIVELNVEELLIDIEFIKRKLKWKWSCPFTYVKIFSHYIDEIFAKPLFKKIDKCKQVFSFDNLENLNSRILYAIKETKKAMLHLYNNFIKENYDQKIIESYLFLEETFTEWVWYTSFIEDIFPNTNNSTLRVFIAEKIKAWDYNIDISEIVEFLKRQNKENIKTALSDNSWVSPDTILNNYFPIYKYDEQKWVVVYDYDAVDSWTFFTALNMREKYRIWYNWWCPFAKMKSWTQQKNIFIEEFEFFDNLIIKLIKAVSYKQWNNWKSINLSSIF